MRNLETPGIYPDTPEISHPETPGINLDIPGCQNCEHRVVLGSGVCVRVRIISKLQSYCMHSYLICIRVAAAAEEVVYEVVAEP